MTTLLFTVGQNGYDVAYERCIESHRAYARRLGAEYEAIIEPKRMPDTAISAWLKIPVLLGALQSGYEWVGFIDADAEVRSTAPDFRDALKTESIGMVNGRSGRVNSGVILVRNSEVSRQFFRRVMGSIVEEIPDEARANLKYENGNVIFVTSELGGVEELDRRWNNTADRELDDFIRHYTGPLRETYKRPLLAELRYRRARLRVAKPTPQPATRSTAFVQQLTEATADAQARYSALRLVRDGSLSA